MILAQSLFDFGLQDGMFTIVRAIASVGGAIVGWFLGDVLTRLLYRISFKGATPSPLLLVSKLASAGTLAALIWLFMPIGGNGGGFGFGPGKGGAPGKGGGEGDGKGSGPIAVKDAKTEKTTKDDKRTPNTATKLEPVEIEIIDTKRFQDDGKDRVFLVKRAEPALSASELEEYLKTNRAKIEVTPVLTGGSITGLNSIDILISLTKKYSVKTLQTKTPGE